MYEMEIEVDGKKKEMITDVHIGIKLSEEQYKGLNEGITYNFKDIVRGVVFNVAITKSD